MSAEYGAMTRKHETCRHCNGKRYQPGDPEGAPIESCDYCCGSGRGHERFIKAGKHLHDTAKSLGWHDDGEGAYEYVQRISYEQGVADAMLLADERDAVDLIQDLMDRRGLVRADVFSAKSRASEIMNRKRPLTLALIRKLHFEFGLPAEKLIAPYRSPSSENMEG